MNTAITTIDKPRVPAIVMIAGVAVVLFCAAGTAAIMGWIPTSIGSNAPTSALSPIGQLAGPALPVHAPTSHRSNATSAPYYHQTARAAQAEAAPGFASCTACGTVESVRETTVRGDGSGLGAISGAVAGGLLGNQVGGGHGKELMTVAGAIGGAYAGNRVETQVNATHRYEVTIHMDNGSTRTIKQSEQPSWQAGDQVKIVDGVLRSHA